MINLNKPKYLNVFHEIYFLRGENKGIYKINILTAPAILVKLLKDIDNFDNYDSYLLCLDFTQYILDPADLKINSEFKKYKDPKKVYNILLNNFYSSDFENIVKNKSLPEKYKNRILNDIDFKHKNHVFRVLAQIIRANKNRDHVLSVLNNYGYKTISQFKTKYLKFLHDHGLMLNTTDLNLKIAA